MHLIDTTRFTYVINSPVALILTKIMDAQRRTARIFLTQCVDCASCMCDWVLDWKTLCEVLDRSIIIDHINDSEKHGITVLT